MASNYTDRLIDLVAFHGPQKIGYATLNQNLFLDTSGEVCTGIQKLVQEWLTLFLTPVGSITFDKSRGTSFMIDIFTASTEAEVYNIFNLANAFTKLQMLSAATDDMKADELLDSVVLDSIELYLGNLSLYMTITSKAGTSAKIILPIDTNPLML